MRVERPPLPRPMFRLERPPVRSERRYPQRMRAGRFAEKSAGPSSARDAWLRGRDSATMSTGVEGRDDRKETGTTSSIDISRKQDTDRRGKRSRSICVPSDPSAPRNPSPQRFRAQRRWHASRFVSSSRLDDASLEEDELGGIVEGIPSSPTTWKRFVARRQLEMDPRAEDFDAHEFLEHQVDAAPSIHSASRSRGRGRRKYRSSSRKRSMSPVERRSRHTKGRISSRSRSPVRGNRAGRYENRHITEEERRKRDREKLERDARTVFAYSITTKADERDIFEFFSQAGKVVDVRIITDRHTGKSKGLAYIELAQPADVRKALDLNGRRLLDHPVLVKPSEAEKNLAWGGGRVAPPIPPHPRAFMPPFVANLPPPPFPPGYANLPSNVGECRVLVNNLPLSMNELELKALFDPFGEVVLAVLERDTATGKSKGSGFVQFKNTMFAARAIQQLNGLIVSGSRIGVRMGAIFPVAPVSVEPGLTENLDLALEGNEGLKLSSQARVALMSRLARGDPTLVSTPSAKSPPKSEDKVSTSVMDHLDQGLLGPSSPIPTPCLLLKNMFDPEQEEGEDWDKEIEEDVRLECEKFGRLEHIFIDKSSKGHVYLKFFDVKAAEQAQVRLHGRWFAGKQVVAVYQFLKTYNKRFLPEVVEGQR